MGYFDNEKRKFQHEKSNCGIGCGSSSEWLRFNESEPGPVDATIGREKRLHRTAT
jgi:hypothetical protein